MLKFRFPAKTSTRQPQLDEFARNEFEIVWSANQEAALSSELIPNTISFDLSRDGDSDDELLAAVQLRPIGGDARR